MRVFCFAGGTFFKNHLCFRSIFFPTVLSSDFWKIPKVTDILSPFTHQKGNGGGRGAARILRATLFSNWTYVFFGASWINGSRFMYWLPFGAECADWIWPYTHIRKRPERRNNSTPKTRERGGEREREIYRSHTGSFYPKKIRCICFRFLRHLRVDRSAPPPSHEKLFNSSGCLHWLVLPNSEKQRVLPNTKTRRIASKFCVFLTA